MKTIRHAAGRVGVKTSRAVLQTLFTLFMLCVIASSIAQAEPPKAQIMILGVAHLIAKHDVHNSSYADSPHSAKRQAEIADIVARLERFHPTKVLIEAPFGDRKYTEQYRRYLAGRFSLGANEIYQYAFKLAARSGNGTIYPVDTWGASLYDDTSPSGKRIDAYLIAHFTSVKDRASDAEIARDHYLELHGTYLDELRYLNTESAILANASWYSVFDGMGRDADQAGSAYVSQWYARNCYIFANVLSVVKPGDRVVLIMGQGHTYLLRELVRLNPTLAYVDPSPYLK